MAFSSQSFRAPKINKGNFSSPLSSSASKISGSISAPKLNTTKISFIKKENSPIVEAVNDNAESLTQTNEILIEIQKQLAFDFANRIAEEKDAIKKIKAEESRRRFGEEEKAVEGTNKIKKGLFGAFDKVMAPAKGIFDKLLDFFSIVLTGFIANKAFDWLKNKENREKITGILDWIGKNWKLLVGLFVVGKLIGPLGKLIGFAKLLAKLFKRGGDLGPDRLKRAKNLSADCGSLLKSLAKCIKGGLGKAFIAAVAGGLIGSGYLFSRIPDTVDKPGDTPAVDLPDVTPAPTYNLDQLLSQRPGTYTPEQEKFLIDQGYDDYVRGGMRGTDIFGDLATLLLSFGLVKGGQALLRSAPTIQAPNYAQRFSKMSESVKDSYQLLRTSPQLSKFFKGRDIFGFRNARLNNLKEFRSLESGMKSSLRGQSSSIDIGRKQFMEGQVPGGSNIIDLSPRIADRVASQASRSITNADIANYGALLSPFILPLVRSQATPKPAPVATQTVSIDAVDRNNMYRRTTPNIYGMGVFAF